MPKYLRTDLKRIIEQLLSTDEVQTVDKDHWKYKIAVDMVNVGLDYLVRAQEFKTVLHQRLFQDLRDTIGVGYHRGNQGDSIKT